MTKITDNKSLKIWPLKYFGATVASQEYIYEEYKSMKMAYHPDDGGTKHL
jgi:hypothetical protein